MSCRQSERPPAPLPYSPQEVVFVRWLLQRLVRKRRDEAAAAVRQEDAA